MYATLNNVKPFRWSGAVSVIALLLGQPATADQLLSTLELAFEVASVKPNKDETLTSSFQWTPQGVRISNYTLLRIVLTAYDLRDFQVVGAPDWMASDRFDVNARAPEQSRPSREELSLMLQALVRERFGLVARRETRTGPVFNLVLARQDGRLGPRLTRAGVNCLTLTSPEANAENREACGLRFSYDTIEVNGQPLHGLLVNLMSLLRRPVVDQTGLTGPFNYFLQFNRGEKADSPHPSLFAALDEQLGLKLESARGPVEFLVIDNVGPLIPD